MIMMIDHDVSDGYDSNEMLMIDGDDDDNDDDER